MQAVSEESNRVFLFSGVISLQAKRNLSTKRHLIIESPHPSPLSSYRGFIRQQALFSMQSIPLRARQGRD
jgi:uracil DNA glycosylase